MKILARTTAFILVVLFVFVITFDPLANFIFVQPVYRAYRAAEIQYQHWAGIDPMTGKPKTQTVRLPEHRFVLEIENEY